MYDHLWRVNTIYFDLCQRWRSRRNNKKDKHNNKGKISDSSCDYSSTTIRWRNLLEASGTDLWELRDKILADANGTTSGGCPVSSIRLVSGYSNPGGGSSRPIHVVADRSDFVRLEEHFGMDKIPIATNDDNNKNSNNKSDTTCLPLTQCTGSEWEFQRKAIQKKAFRNILALSREAVKGVDWKEIIGSNGVGAEGIASVGTFTVDLRDVVLEASRTWLVRLFCGKDNKDSTRRWVVGDAMLWYWRSIRAQNKCKNTVRKTYKELTKAIAPCFDDDGRSSSDGLLRELVDALGRERAEINAVYAMIAAFDAIQSIVFWTIWNLSRDEESSPPQDEETTGSKERSRAKSSGSMWEKCHGSIMHDEKNIQRRTDIEGLVAFKKQSTTTVETPTPSPPPPPDSNEQQDQQHLSLLARAVMETVRVYPPIWTLPRVCPAGNGGGGGKRMVAKLDVLSANGATDRRWDPTNINPTASAATKVASFGIGKRHCPAGTAALVAAYEMLRDFVDSYEKPTECDAGRALRSAYLGPTLCTSGRQMVVLRPRTECRSQSKPNE